jgi:hypothetical protein
MFVAIFAESVRTEQGSKLVTLCVMDAGKLSAGGVPRSFWKRILTRFRLTGIGYVYAVKWNAVVLIKIAKKIIDTVLLIDVRYKGT